MAKKKIYLVEDSRVVCELFAFELQKNFDCEVMQFSNSKDLLSNMLNQPDVIILDYYLDSFDNVSAENGKDILEKIQRINKDIPVIIFSGQKDIKVAIDLIEAGAIDYVNKNDANFHEQIIQGVKNVFELKHSKKTIKKSTSIINNDFIQIISLLILTSIILFFLYLI